MVMAYRYQPRDHMVNPTSFGRTAGAVWKPYGGKPGEVQLQISASFLQHLAAIETLTAMENLGWTLGDLHRRVDKASTLDTLRRKLYGEAPADFDDIVAWARAVGDVRVLPAPADVDRMMPPTQ